MKLLVKNQISPADIAQFMLKQLTDPRIFAGHRAYRIEPF